MAAKCIVVLTVALMLGGCAGPQQPMTAEAQKDEIIVEVEKFALTNANVQKLATASAGEVVVLQDETSKAETTIKLSNGIYTVTVYALAPSNYEDAFYMTVGQQWEERLWPPSFGEILPAQEVNYTQQADGPCKIVISFAEPNVQLDRVQFNRIQ